MKKIIVLSVVLLALVACVTSCSTSSSGGFSSNKTYTISVTGSSGVAFSGSIGGIDSNGDYISQSVDGTVPHTYTFTGSMVSVVFQNQGESGTLTVQILEGSTILKQASTTAAYGVVSVATD